MAKATRQQTTDDVFDLKEKEELTAAPSIQDSDEEALVSKLASAPVAKPKQKIRTEPEVYIFKILLPEGTPPKKYESVSNEMPIFDEETESNRTIRLLRGVPSIFVDEQNGLTPTFIQRNKVDIVFNNGFLRVARTNKTLLNFLLNSDEFDKKKNRMKSRRPKFTLINTADIEQEELEKEQFKFEAIKYAMSAKEEDMIPHAVFLRIPMVNVYGEQKSPAKIRIEYADYASKKPEYFMKTANSPVTKAAFFVTRAIELGILDITKRQGYVLWGESGHPIMELKFGKPVVDQISEYALSDTNESKAFYKQLKAVL